MNEIIYDTHLHTEFSTDSNTPVDSLIGGACDNGLKGICITDHMDYGFPKEEYSSDVDKPFIFDVDEYISTLDLKREKYSSKIKILTGIECGLQSDDDVINYNKTLCSSYDFDQIIGSIHLVNKKDPYYPKFWENISVSDGIKMYFETTLDNISKFNNFDTLGHMDYIVRYAPNTSEYNPKEYYEITDEIYKILISNNIALEVNTSALKTGYGIINPHPELLKRYRELGGELITIGSDAHSPEYIAYGFSETADLLRQIGFTNYVIFNKRQPISLSL